jgi:hypothetical protein
MPEFWQRPDAVRGRLVLQMNVGEIIPDWTTRSLTDALRSPSTQFSDYSGGPSRPGMVDEERLTRENEPGRRSAP